MTKRNSETTLNRDEVTEQIVQIWREVLQVNYVAANDEFVVLGGDSLLALAMLMRVEKRFQLRYRPSDISAGLTVSELAKLVVKPATQPTPNAKNNQSHPNLNICASLNQEQYLRSILYADLNLRQRHDSMGISLEVHGDLDAQVVERTFAAIAERHSIFRTSFTPTVDFGSRQIAGWRNICKLFAGTGYCPRAAFDARVHSHTSGSHKRFDLRALDPQQKHLEATRIQEELTTHAFDYEAPVLMRSAMIRLESRFHRVLICISTIASDGWSRRVFYNEFTSLYSLFSDDVFAVTPPMQFQYSDFSAWERQHYNESKLNAIATSWSSDYGDITTTHAQVAEKGNRPSVSSNETISKKWELPARDFDALIEFIDTSGVTAYIGFLAAVFMAIAKQFHRSQVVVWTGFANRAHPDVEFVIGPFSNNHLVSIHVDSNLTVDELIQKTLAAVAVSRKYESVPLSTIVDRLPNDLFSENKYINSREDLADISCEYVRASEIEAPLGLKILHSPLWNGRDQMPLRVRLEQARTSAYLEIICRADVFERSFVDEMLSDTVKSFRKVILQNG